MDRDCFYVHYPACAVGPQNANASFDFDFHEENTEQGPKDMASSLDCCLLAS